MGRSCPAGEFCGNTYCMANNPNCRARPAGVSYQGVAAKRGFTCVLGTGCDRSPVCVGPCAAKSESAQRHGSEGPEA